MKRDPNLCQFVFCPHPWTKRITSADSARPITPLQFCEEHAAPYVAIGRAPGTGGRQSSGRKVIITDRHEKESIPTS
jgi:hypothetical protein